jgi:hypothetical protein
VIYFPNYDDIKSLEHGPNRFNAYKVTIGYTFNTGTAGPVCLVLAENDQEAIDTVVDFLTEYGLFAFPDPSETGIDDSCGNYGNFGIAIDDELITIEDLSRRAYHDLAGVARHDLQPQLQKIISTITDVSDFAIKLQDIFIDAARLDCGHDLRIPVPTPYDVADLVYRMIRLRVSEQSVRCWSFQQRQEVLDWLHAPTNAQGLRSDLPEVLKSHIPLFDRSLHGHYLKTIQPHFDDIWEGRKSFELRKEDRTTVVEGVEVPLRYQVGDTLFLEEYEVDHYTGRMVIVTVTHVLRDAPQFGLLPDYVIMSIRVRDRAFRLAEEW